jgi:hypothetical protein
MTCFPIKWKGVFISFIYCLFNGAFHRSVKFLVDHASTAIFGSVSRRAHEHIVLFDDAGSRATDSKNVFLDYSVFEARFELNIKQVGLLVTL